MTDLEQQLRSEFDRQAASAPGAAATEDFALSLMGRRGSRRLRWLIPAVAALVLVVPILTVVLAHRHKSVAPATTTDPQALIGVRWVLTQSIDANGTHTSTSSGQPTEILQFDRAGRVTFNLYCEAVSGSIRLEPGRMVVGATRSTPVSCLPVGVVQDDRPADPMELLVHATSSGTFSWQIVGDHLTITAADGRGLIFTGPPTTTTTDPKSLVGIEWLLTRDVAADGTSQPAPTGRSEQILRFDGHGGISFDQNCNFASGSVRLAPGELLMGEVAVTAMGCAPNTDNAMDLMANPKLSWRLVGQMLTIEAPDHRQLIFTVKPSIFPSVYPGAEGITVTEGRQATADYRLFYVPVHSQTVYAKFEWREAAGATWSQYDWQASTTLKGDAPAGTDGCEPAPIAGDHYLVGWASAQATKVVVRRTDNTTVTVALHKLANAGGLQLYAGFLGIQPTQSATVTMYGANGTRLGQPCTIRS